MAAEHATTSERSPLLSPDAGVAAHNDIVRDGPGVRGNDSDNDQAASSARAQSLAASRRITVAALCMLLLLVVEFAATVISIALSQILESIVCRDVFPEVDDPVLDQRCKDDNVQSELSSIQGWAFTFAIVPGVVTAVPYGVAADKYGRRIILSLALLGMFLTEAAALAVCRFSNILPLRLVWLAALLSFIGGGPYVFNAMIFTIASDVSTVSQRSTTFFYVAAIAIGGRLISGPLAFLAVERSAWLSIYIGMACLFMSVFIAATFPETRSLSVVKAGDNGGEGEDDRLTANADTTIPENPTVSRSLWRYISGILELKRMAALIRYFFWENTRLGLLLFSLIFTSLDNYATVILMQYTRKRFGWSWAKAGLLTSISASVNLVLLIAILPAISQLLLVKFRLSPFAKDASLARAGMVALLIGTFGIGLSATPPLLVTSLMIFSLGYGYESSLRSILVVMAGEQHTAMLFTAVSVLQNIGMLIAGPMMAWTFRLGLRWGGFWIGLPFIATGCLLSCAACMVFAARLQDPSATRQDSTAFNNEVELLD